MKPDASPLLGAEWTATQQFGFPEGLLDTNVRGGRCFGLTMVRPPGLWWVGGAFWRGLSELLLRVASVGQQASRPSRGPRHAMAMFFNNKPQLQHLLS